MYHAYILQSEIDKRYYFGYTSQDVFVRLKKHNKGDSPYTRKFRPWKLVWYAAFSTKEKAKNFEKYLKTGSGHAFSRKRLI